MRVLLIFVLLAVVGIPFVYLSWRFRRRLLILFGVAKPEAVECPASEDWSPQNGQSLPSAEPMIIVTSDGARCDAISYDELRGACARWAPRTLLGSGGSASVHSAELPRFGRVAVKRFQAGQSTKEWSRELEALCQCRHPNILEILGYSNDGPENLIVMPCMEGGTLSAALPRMYWAPRGLVLGQVCRAVSFLHAKRIVHADVKSSNVLLEISLRHCRLADFGLAKERVSGATSTTAVLRGSPGYLAPELLMRPPSERSDAFALGVVFLEILTGMPAIDRPLEEGGETLAEKAVHSGVFRQELLDVSARWPDQDVKAVSEQAVPLTAFMPQQRRLPADVEQDIDFRAHLERARDADVPRRAPELSMIGAASRPGS